MGKAEYCGFTVPLAKSSMAAVEPGAHPGGLSLERESVSSVARLLQDLIRTPLTVQVLNDQRESKPWTSQ